MSAVLRLGGGLALLIAANVALGSVKAIIAREFDFKIFWKGLIKGLIVAFAFAAVYLSGYLNPELVVLRFEDQTVNLQTAVYLVLLTGFTYYAGAVLKKLKALVTGKKKPPAKSEDEETNSV